MIIKKNKLLIYFENNKWLDETLESSFYNDFNNSISVKSLYKNYTYNLLKSEKVSKIKYFYIYFDGFSKHENTIIFIPLYKESNKLIGISYLFTDKLLSNLETSSMKSFCKMIIDIKDLSKFHEI